MIWSDVCGQLSVAHIQEPHQPLLAFLCLCSSQSTSSNSLETIEKQVLH